MALTAAAQVSAVGELVNTGSARTLVSYVRYTRGVQWCWAGTRHSPHPRVRAGTRCQEACSIQHDSRSINRAAPAAAAAAPAAAALAALSSVEGSDAYAPLLSAAAAPPAAAATAAGAPACCCCCCCCDCSGVHARLMDRACMWAISSASASCTWAATIGSRRRGSIRTHGHICTSRPRVAPVAHQAMTSNQGLASKLWADDGHIIAGATPTQQHSHLVGEAAGRCRAQPGKVAALRRLCCRSRTRR